MAMTIYKTILKFDFIIRPTQHRPDELRTKD